MKIRSKTISRRGAGLVAGLAVAAGVLFNLPAHAENEACPGLQATYIANPAARPLLLPQLQRLGCSIPTSTTTAPSTTTTTKAPGATTTTSTTINLLTTSCPALSAQYLAATAATRVQILPLFAQFGCTVPVIPASTTSTAPTSSTTSTSTTTTTVVASLACTNLQAAYLANPGARAQLGPILREQGCTIPQT